MCYEIMKIRTTCYHIQMDKMYLFNIYPQWWVKVNSMKKVFRANVSPGIGAYISVRGQANSDNKSIKEEAYTFPQFMRGTEV